MPNPWWALNKYVLNEKMGSVPGEGKIMGAIVLKS